MRGHNSKVERELERGSGHERNMGIPAMSVPFPFHQATQDARCGTAYNQVYASDVWQRLARLKDILLGKILELPLDVKCKISAISVPLSFFCVTLLLSSHSGSVSKVSQSRWPEKNAIFGARGWKIWGEKFASVEGRFWRFEWDYALPFTRGTGSVFSLRFWPAVAAISLNHGSSNIRVGCNGKFLRHYAL